METKFFGYMHDGTPVSEYKLENRNFRVEILSYGGIIKRFLAFGTDVVMGYDTLEAYLTETSYQGALVGRVANRIADGKFILRGTTYTLYCNDQDGTVHLHGGKEGFSMKNWTLVTSDDTSVTLRLFSPDGEEGYPGNLVLDVTYQLGENGLTIDYHATCDAPCPVNLTNHAYFNLDGCRGDSILGYSAWIDADAYSEVDAHLIPTEDIPVRDTRFDFTTPRVIGAWGEGNFGGYDHNFMLNQSVTSHVNGIDIYHAAMVENDHLRFDLYTDQPCVQFYIGNALEGGNPFRGGVTQVPHTTFCLEAQIRPDSVNHGKGILMPGEVYRQTTIYAFTHK